LPGMPPCRRAFHSFQRSATPLSSGMSVSKRTERMKSQPRLTPELIRTSASGRMGWPVHQVGWLVRRSAGPCTGLGWHQVGWTMRRMS